MSVYLLVPIEELIEEKGFPWEFVFSKGIYMFQTDRCLKETSDLFESDSTQSISIKQ